MLFRLRAHRLVKWLIGLAQRGLALVSGGRLPPFCSVQVLALRDGKALVLQPADGSKASLPGGYLQTLEQPAEAALRELREETGRSGRLVAFLGATRLGWDDGVASVNLAYLCEVDEGPLRGSHEGAPLWLPLEEAESRLGLLGRKVLDLWMNHDTMAPDERE